MKDKTINTILKIIAVPVILTPVFALLLTIYPSYKYDVPLYMPLVVGWSITIIIAILFEISLFKWVKKDTKIINKKAIILTISCLAVMALTLALMNYIAFADLPDDRWIDGQITDIDIDGVYTNITFDNDETFMCWSCGAQFNLTKNVDMEMWLIKFIGDDVWWVMNYQEMNE